MSGSTQVMEAHTQRTKRVATQVRSFYDKKQPFRIFHGSTSSTRTQEKDRKKMISTSDFTEILCIDAEKRIAIVEPNVSMEKLVDATLTHGLVAPVIMEFKNITVGGGFSGTSGESSSFRHGVFDKIVNSIEIVLGDGQIVHASRTENSDLFHGAAGSFGTLGVVTKIEVQLVEAGSFMELEYHAITSAPEAVQTIESYTANEKIQYLDGIMFSKTSGIIIAGRMTNTPTPNHKVTKYLSRSDPWFYLRAQEILDKEIPRSSSSSSTNNKTHTEYVPLKDYLFRFDRGAFWGGRHAFTYHFAPFNPLTRYLLDDLTHTKTMYTALHSSGLAQEFIVQDIGIPYASTSEFIDYLDAEFGLYPLWLCPLKLTAPFPLTPTGKHYSGDEVRVINIGVWGPGPRDKNDFIAANRAIEAMTKSLDGLKCLYAHAFYTAAEFWYLYDKHTYDTLREKYNAVLLPSVFEKVTSNGFGGDCTWVHRLRNVRPVRGIYGALCLFWSGGLPYARVHQGLSILLSPLLLGIFVAAWVISFAKDLFGLRERERRWVGKEHVE